MQPLISLDGSRITPGSDAAQERRLWASVREVAAAVVSDDEPPDGFVRHALPIGEAEVDVWTGVTEEGRASTTLVVVVSPQDDPWPEPVKLQERYGLTPRESQVALLLADRRSNKEIARELSIAHKTAERHTSRVLSKLGTTSRRDVGRVLKDQREGGAITGLRPRSASLTVAAGPAH
jgi:DNA-binding CsgD family transcriptional regulator